MAFVSKSHLKMGRQRIDDKKNEEDDVEGQQRQYQKQEEEMTLLQIFRRISQIPVFIYLVAQGLFGASESLLCASLLIAFFPHNNISLLLSCTQQQYRTKFRET